MKIPIQLTEIDVVVIDWHSDAHLEDVAMLIAATSANWKPSAVDVAKMFGAPMPHIEEIGFLAHIDGCAVGMAMIGNMRFVDEPLRFIGRVRVRPEQRNRGIGHALTNLIRDWVQARPCNELLTVTDVDDVDGIRFAESLGFEEVERRYEQTLVPPALPIGTLLEPALQKLREQNIVIITLAEWEHDRLRTSTLADESIEQMLYALDNEAMSDEPTIMIGAPVSFDQWNKDFLDGRDRAGVFVALYQDEPIGMCVHWDEDGMILIATTAIKREWRRRGIARALKLSGVQYAQQRKMTLRAMNAGANEAILALNKSLGFERVGGSVYWRSPRRVAP